MNCLNFVPQPSLCTSSKALLWNLTFTFSWVAVLMSPWIYYQGSKLLMPRLLQGTNRIQKTSSCCFCAHSLVPSTFLPGVNSIRMPTIMKYSSTFFLQLLILMSGNWKSNFCLLTKEANILLLLSIRDRKKNLCILFLKSKL